MVLSEIIHTSVLGENHMDSWLNGWILAFAHTVSICTPVHVGGSTGIN